MCQQENYESINKWGAPMSSHLCVVIFFFSNTWYKIMLLQHLGCPDMTLARQDSLRSTKVLISIRNLANEAVMDMPSLPLQPVKRSFSPIQQRQGPKEPPLGSWTCNEVCESHIPWGCWWQQEPLAPRKMTFLDSSSTQAARAGNHRVPQDGSHKAKPLFSALLEELAEWTDGAATQTASSGATLQQGTVLNHLSVPLLRGDQF